MNGEIILSFYNRVCFIGLAPEVEAWSTPHIVGWFAKKCSQRIIDWKVWKNAFNAPPRLPCGLFSSCLQESKKKQQQHAFLHIIAFCFTKKIDYKQLFINISKDESVFNF